MITLEKEVAEFIHIAELPRLVEIASLSDVSPNFLSKAESIGELTGSWNPVEIYTPTAESLKREKQRFFDAFDSGEAYEPVFSYSAAEKIDTASVRPLLANLLSEVRTDRPTTNSDRLFRVALRAKILDDLATCDIIDGIVSQDEALIRSGMMRKYPTPSNGLIAFAEQEYGKMTDDTQDSRVKSEALLTSKQQEKLTATTFDASQIKEAFEYILNGYGILRTEKNLNGYQIVINEDTTSVDVRDKSDSPMTIYIPSSHVVTGDNLCELLVHEIEGHARQSMNGEELFKIGGGRLKLDDEALYEGLAMRQEDDFNEKFFGIIPKAPLPWFTLAVKKAFEGASFSEIFADQFEMRMHVALQIPTDRNIAIDLTIHAEQIEAAKKAAWTTTYRVMRGHVDMQNPLAFAMSKDIAYLKGWLIDHQLRQAGFGRVNEMAVIMSGGLKMIARTGMHASELPHPFKNISEKYINDVLLPQIS